MSITTAIGMRLTSHPIHLMKATSTVVALLAPASLLRANDTDLSEKLANPISDLIRLPIPSENVGSQYCNPR
jgi:hypothetical protein